jgi:transcriptional regulator with XRE-family HTH domain
MPDNSKLTETVRKLRFALGDTQQEFAHRLGLAIATVVRYEHNRPPKAKALVQLERVARENGLDEYAATFRAALKADLGSGSASEFTPGRYGSLSGEEQDLLEALELALKRAAHKSRAEKVRKILFPVVKEIRHTREFMDALEDSRRGIVRLLKMGKTIQDLRGKFTAEHIADAVFESGDHQTVGKHVDDVYSLLIADGWSIADIVKTYHAEADQVINVAIDREQYQAVRDYEDRNENRE